VHQRRFVLAPITRLGHWSAGLLGGLFAIVALRLLIESRQDGGADNLWTRAAALSAAACALGAMATGWIAILRKGERSVPVILAVAMGTLITLWELGQQAIAQ